MAEPARSIFICYRRDDTRHVAGRLRDRLIEEFGPTAVFMDVDTIRPGTDFTTAVDDALGSCRIVLVVIGPAWLSGTDRYGRPRIADPADHVAVEIITALRHSLPILPVLTDGARMPSSHDLPPALAGLATRNAVRVDHESFGRDSAVVVDTVARSVRPRRRGRRRFLAPLLAAGALLLVALGVYLYATSPGSIEVSERVLTGHVGEVTAVATAERDGRPVVISAGEDLSIRIWDLAGGEPIGSPLTGHADRIHAVATAVLDGRTVIVSSSNDGTIRLWDLATGAPIGQPRAGSGIINVITTTELDGRPILVTTTNSNDIDLVDLTTDQVIGPPLTDRGGLLASASGVLDGRQVVVTVDGDNTTRSWDLRTGTAIGPAIACPTTDFICTIAITEVNRRPVIVLGGGDGGVQLFDLATGEPFGRPATSPPGGAPVLAAGTLDGRPIVAIGSAEGVVQVWDIDVDGFTRHGPPMAAAHVNVLTITDVGSDPILVAGDTDGSVHVWNLRVRFGP